MTVPVANSAEELAGHFMRLFAAGEIETLAALYEEDALFVPGPGQEARGRAAVGGALGAMHAAGAAIDLQLKKMHVVDDIAVYSNIATVKGLNPDGSDVVIPTIEVARKQGDGTWRYLVDDPFFLA